MLAKEKKRILCSLAAGAVLASGAFFWPRGVAYYEARSLRALVAACRRSNPTLPPLKEAAEEVAPSDDVTKETPTPIRINPEDFSSSGYLTEGHLPYWQDEAEVFISKNFHARLGDIIRDPKFAKFWATEKREIIESVLHADKEFGELSLNEQAAARKRIYDGLGLADLACRPAELFVSDQLGEIQQEIVDMADRRQKELAKEDDATKYAVLVFAFFCLPLIWYFLLDRLREVSAALSGRDQSP